MQSRYSRLMIAGSSLVMVLILLVLTSSASATVMKYMNTIDLIEASDVIVLGTITDREHFQDDSRDGQVMTRWSINVDRGYLGATKDQTVEFLQWGGIDSAGNVHQIPGDAHFERGEKVILFLHRAKRDQKLYLTALSQSKYSVLTEGSETRVFRDLSHVSFMGEGETPSKVGPRSNERATLASFEAEVMSLIAALKGGSQ